MLGHSTHIVSADPAEVSAIAPTAYDRTCRTDFTAPGFCVVKFSSEIDSVGLRRAMVELKRAMAAIHEQRAGQTFVYLSAARFDQQVSTKLHLDGGPDECFLMLGYEPSEVDSQIEISDYARCAYDLDLGPKLFMRIHNPMIGHGYELLRTYTTNIGCFRRDEYQIVCINNSSASVADPAAIPSVAPAWQGTLHAATILTPDESKRRIINSTMIAPAAVGSADPVSMQQIEDFVSTSAVRRQGYDKLHLSDDQ